MIDGIVRRVEAVINVEEGERTEYRCIVVDMVGETFNLGTATFPSAFFFPFN